MRRPSAATTVATSCVGAAFVAFALAPAPAPAQGLVITDQLERAAFHAADRNGDGV
jgi:hypothetical protein